jgi:hypothetical protein
MALLKALMKTFYAPCPDRRRGMSLGRRRSVGPIVDALEHRYLLSTYTIQDLGTLGGILSQAHALNASGQIAGVSTIGSGDQRALDSYGGRCQGCGADSL